MMASATPKLHQCSLTGAVLAVSLALAMPLALQAQSPATPMPATKSDKSAKPEARTESASEKSGGTKSVAAKRQKLRDCGVKWHDEKKANGLTGKAAYLKFLSACMKG
jgi:hypothetical protein